jgi:hypothetical protein
MKKIIFASVALLLFAVPSFAQKGGKEKVYAKYFYAPTSSDYGPVTLTVVDAIATEAFLKFKLKIKNNTSDYIIVNASDIVLKANGKEYRAVEKSLLVGPNEEESKVIDYKATDLRVENFTIALNGFAKVPASTPAFTVENFKLPVSNNDFTAGSFKVVHVSNTKKTDVVAVKFIVTYSGNKVGIVDPSKTALLSAKGNEFANMASRLSRRPFLLQSGGSEDFTLTWKNIPVSEGDMQFANLEILWRDMFREATPQPVASGELEVLMDRGLTDGKNK